MRSYRWLLGSSPVLALAFVLPPFCGPLGEPGGYGHGGVAGSSGGVAGSSGGVAGSSGGVAGSSGGVVESSGGEGGAPEEAALPDRVLGCDPLPWPDRPSFEILEGEGRALGVSANGTVVVGTSYESVPARAIIWDPNRHVVPNPDSLIISDLSLTNCDGTVFASDNVYDPSAPDFRIGIRQTRTGAPVRLAIPPDIFGAPDTMLHVKSFSADGSVLVGSADNDARDGQSTPALWDPSGAVTVLFELPHTPLVVSPDGLHVAGHSNCWSPGCPGISIWDWSAAEGETHPLAAVFWRNGPQPVLSHDRTTAAGATLDSFEELDREVKWFRGQSDATDIQCLTDECHAVAISSHGSVLLLSSFGGESAIWIETKGIRLLREFLLNSGVQLPTEADSQPLVATAISDDARVIVGYFGIEHPRPFRVTLSRRAYF